MVHTTNDKLVLLFFKDYERDSFFKNDRYIKRLVRPLYHRFSTRQKTSGFFVWYQLLVKALQQQGYTVHVNNYTLARRNPDHPIGLVGYPHILENWNLPNPAVLGPAMLDHPKIAPELMDDPRYRFYLVTCAWMEDMFKPFYGSKCVQWHAGMDTTMWNDTSTHPKRFDVLIYDKIRWNRSVYEHSLLNPIVDVLEKRGLTYQIVRYQYYDHTAYKDLLSQSRCMIFLCEHETQGMAYQEALASNVPVLAWNNGYWLDPRRPEWEPEPVPATSIPYFSAECGERFDTIKDFPKAFDTFWSNLDQYHPRYYVQQALSFEGSATLYMKYYREAAAKHVPYIVQ